MACRIELDQAILPLYVLETHFPNDGSKHHALWAKISHLVKDYTDLGHVILMGDFNARTGLNGDPITNTKGRLLLNKARDLDLHLVNEMGVCTDYFTHIQENRDGSAHHTTIDYVLVSMSLTAHTTRLELSERLGSDHKVLLLTLTGLTPAHKSTPGLREVWSVENLPTNAAECLSFSSAFQAAMAPWSSNITQHISALSAANVETQRIVDILDWSFQAAFEETCEKHVGTKLVGPRATPRLDRALHLLTEHRRACERELRSVMRKRNGDPAERASAVHLYRQAKSNFFQATRKRKDLADLEQMIQIENAQGDSKIFWARAKHIRNGMRASKSPPPMAINEQGTIASDPVEVLRIWKRFSADIANPSPEDEKIYDEDHKSNTEARLATLRSLRINQPELDKEISETEIFRAIRKMKPGKAAGSDGILTSILKHAAAAVGTNKMRPNNNIVSALALMFNYIFEKEAWPERWSSGIVFPLFKGDSRLDPGNYRPITLLSVVGKLFRSIIEDRLSTWSERVGACADEQGGFRRNRGTIDQIFILREIILHRKDLGLPTLVTYIDVRKAFDTVWREGNYVRLFDIGVQGKMWRQIHNMNERTRSKIRLPMGDTDWFDIKRGVAQGATESPWLYNNFVNGLADCLHAENLGIQFKGKPIPLLMYADDVVLLATTIDELHKMNDVASEYARKYRFRHNGSKSAIMLFNADKNLTTRVHRQRWSLSGERVEIKDHYKYLGADIQQNISKWTPHLNVLIAQARRRSLDLAWLCGRNEGLRPRSACTMWKAIIRPILEYAAELWAGDVTKEAAAKAEQIQTNFAKSILGLRSHQGISNHFLRAELGLEPLAARWEKLRLGYWRRLQKAEPRSILVAVATSRRTDLLHGRRSTRPNWMEGTRLLLQERHLDQFWLNPPSCAKLPKDVWRIKVSELVDAHYDRLRETEMRSMNSMKFYLLAKQWEETDKTRAAFPGEVGKPGMLTPAAYLDDRHEHIGTRLKLLSRCQQLPVLQVVAKDEKWDGVHPTCPMCSSGQAETLPHFLLHCEAYKTPRARLQACLARELPNSHTLSDMELTGLLLGGRATHAEAEEALDYEAKRFLKKAWRIRKPVTRFFNDKLCRNDPLERRGTLATRSRAKDSCSTWPHAAPRTGHPTSPFLPHRREF